MTTFTNSEGKVLTYTHDFSNAEQHCIFRIRKQSKHCIGGVAAVWPNNVPNARVPFRFSLAHGIGDIAAAWPNNVPNARVP